MTLIPHLKAPARANLYLTDKCNLRCSHCYAAEFSQYKPLTPVQWKVIVSRLSDAGVLELVLLGGEPLLYPGFSTLLSSLTDTDLGIKISSNCTLVTSEIARALASVAKAGVQASLDGPDSISNDLVRGKGTFELTMRGVSRLQDNGIALTIGTVVTKQNLSSALEMPSFCRSQSIKGVHFMRVVPKGNAAANWNRLCLTNEEWVNFVRRIRQETEKSVLLQIDGTYEYDETLEPMGKCMTGCEAGRYEITILPDGSVVPCEMFPDDVVGNALTDNLLDLWNTHPSYVKFRSAKSKVAEPCSSCPVQYCSGCRFEAFALNHDFFAADPACVRVDLLQTHA